MWSTKYNAGLAHFTWRSVVNCIGTVCFSLKFDATRSIVMYLARAGLFYNFLVGGRPDRNYINEYGCTLVQTDNHLN